MEYIINKIPLRLDLRMNGLKYDTKNIYYKIYMYIVELQNSHGRSVTKIVVRWLFADAESAENGTEHLIGGNLTGDGAEMIEGLSQVLGNQVGGEAFF